MIARLLSFSRVGSYQNPIWHIGANWEIIPEPTALPLINELTIIPFETITKDRLNQIENLDYLSKSNIIIQFCIHEIEYLNTLINKNLKTQIWVDQPLTAQKLDVLKKSKEPIEIVIIPMGQFECLSEIKKLLQTRDYLCRILLIPKKTIHDPFPTPDNYYFWLDELKSINLILNKLIIKQQFDESPIALQNLFLNYNRQNMLEYAKNISSTHYAVVTLSQVLNFFSLNYFSNVFLSLLKPNKPVLFQAIYNDIRQFVLFLKNIFLQSEWRIRKAFWLILVRIYYSIVQKAYYSLLLKSYYSLLKLYSIIRQLYYPLVRIILYLAWPIRKVYWVIKFQIEKRILGYHKNEI